MFLSKFFLFFVVLSHSVFFSFASCGQTIVANAETASTSEEANAQQTRRTVNSEPITISAVGDMMLGSPFPNDTRMPPEDGAKLLEPFTSVLSSADIAFGNLEGPIVDNGISAKCGKNATKCFAFRMPTRYGKYFKDAGFDILNLANNHAGDFGDTGRASTRKVLDDLQIPHSGSDSSEQFASRILEVKGKKVGFISFAHNNISLNINDLATAQSRVQQLKKRADIVVVSFHGGAEGAGATRVPLGSEKFYGESRGNLRAFARTVVDAGADLVLGHGPHVLRGMEVYKGRLVAYSLGNFVTYGWFGLEGATAETLVLETKLAPDGKFLSGKIHAGIQVGRGGAIVDKNGSAIRTLQNLSTLDFGANAPSISNDGTIAPPQDLIAK